ncbi:hypothetical protein QM294_10715 [Acinetobacter junii]|uniref:hypothetical protein n=1 Tax=Acinetobacter junii TaxID=40215 RepID=UPI0012509A11|nr:hypothetical protein [Acinetobacter junii]MDI9721263.1 hypothetical protein [Acinetobacter junii]
MTEIIITQEDIESFDGVAEDEDYVTPEEVQRLRSDLDGVDKLWRLAINDENISPLIVGTNQHNYFWLRWFDKKLKGQVVTDENGEVIKIREKSISLMDLLLPFINANSHIENIHDLFFSFMFRVIKVAQEGRESEQRELIMKSCSLALLVQKLIAGIESDPDRYLNKIRSIQLSKKQSDKVDRKLCIEHWDLTYLNDMYCEDKDLIELLIRNTEANTKQLKCTEEYIDHIFNLNMDLLVGEAV